MGAHESHENIVRRLKRAKGHLESVIEMIETKKPCLEVAQQLHAVSKAVVNAKQLFIKDHIDHCFDGAAMSNRTKLQTSLDEFKEITKYLE